MAVIKRFCPFCDWSIIDKGPWEDKRTTVNLSQLHKIMKDHHDKIERVLQEHVEMHVEEMATIE